MTPLLRAGLACGVIAPLWWIFLIFWGGTQVTGYSLVSDHISELAARGSPFAAVMVGGGFVLTGVLYAIFAVAAAWQLREDRWVWVAGLMLVLAALARIGAGLHACDPGCVALPGASEQMLHHRYASAGYLIMMLAALTWGAIGTRHEGLQHLLALSIGATMWGAVFLVLMTAQPERAGLFQRLAGVSLNAWPPVLALALWRQARTVRSPASPPPSREARPHG